MDSVRLGVSRSIEGYARKLEGEVNVQHPARVWVELQENKSVVNEPERLPTTGECGHHLLQIVKGWKQGIGRRNPPEPIVLVHFGPYALFLHFGDHEFF